MVDIRKASSISRRSSNIISGSSSTSAADEKGSGAETSSAVYPVKRLSTIAKRASQQNPVEAGSPVISAADLQKRPSKGGSSVQSEADNAQAAAAAAIAAAEVARLTGEIASLKQEAQQRCADLASLQLKLDERSKEVASLELRVDEGNLEVGKLKQQVADRDQELAILQQAIGKKKDHSKPVKEAGAGIPTLNPGQDAQDSTAQFFVSLEECLKCRECGRPNLYTEKDHPLLRAAEDSKWLSDELEILSHNKQLYLEMEQRLVHIKEQLVAPDGDDEDSKQGATAGGKQQPFFQPKPGTDSSSFYRARGLDPVKWKQERNFSKGKRGKSFQCALIYTDCTQVLDVSNPPANLAIEDIPSLMHSEIDQFLAARGLREFDAGVYDWFVVPGLPLDREASSLEKVSNAAIVIHPKDRNTFFHNKTLQSQLRLSLKYLGDKTGELLHRLRVHEDCMDALWQERSYFTREVLSRQLWPADANSEKGAKGLLAGMLASLRKNVVGKEEEVCRLEVRLQASEKREEQQGAFLQEAKTLMAKKDEALAYYNHALQTCRGQVKTIQSKSEASECQLWALRHKLAVLAEPMCKIWVRTFLDSVRRQIGQDLCAAFADVVPFQEAASSPHSSKNWNATLFQIYQSPDACALLASKGLHRELLELTRVGAQYTDGNQTLQQLGNAAATSARKPEVAEAICSLDVPDSYRHSLKQLYAYVYGSENDVQHDRLAL